MSSKDHTSHILHWMFKKHSHLLTTLAFCLIGISVTKADDEKSAYIAGIAVIILYLKMFLFQVFKMKKQFNETLTQWLAQLQVALFVASFSFTHKPAYCAVLLVMSWCLFWLYVLIAVCQFMNYNEGNIENGK
jgi:hypothetical protein